MFIWGCYGENGLLECCYCMMAHTRERERERGGGGGGGVRLRMPEGCCGTNYIHTACNYLFYCILCKTLWTAIVCETCYSSCLIILLIVIFHNSMHFFISEMIMLIQNVKIPFGSIKDVHNAKMNQEMPFNFKFNSWKWIEVAEFNLNRMK